ncbi:MAG: DUF6761 family protein [Cyanobacteria bacterium P01_C01_bin.120]
MLQDVKSVRYYQRITDALVDHWNRGYRTDELRLFFEGYISALRHADALEPYLIHRLEDEVLRFLLDSSNFYPTEPELDRDYY